MRNIRKVILGNTMAVVQIQVNHRYPVITHHVTMKLAVDHEVKLLSRVLDRKTGIGEKSGNYISRSDCANGSRQQNVQEIQCVHGEKK